jgi:hypothetical protein
MTARWKALAAAAIAALAPSPGSSAPAPRTSGRVAYATARRLYLDAGAREGLVPGTTLQLRRGEKVVATCRVEVVSETHAACAGTGRAGDVFALPRSAPTARHAAQRTAPPLSEAETARRHRLLEAAAHQKIEYRAPPASPAILSGKSEVQLAYATWVSQRSGSWHEERLDVTVRGAPVGAGLALYADLSARRWSLRPGGANFPSGGPNQLYVWEAELVRRPAEGGLSMALGRVRPWSAPGSTVFDGAQAGWRTKNGVEFGIFGGGVPDPETLAPTFRRATAGGFVAVQSTGKAGSVVRWLREQMRLAYLTTPEGGRRLAVEALSEIALGGMLDLAVDARVTRGEAAAVSLDEVTVDAGLRPFDRFSLIGGFRYQGRSVPELDGPAILYGGAARHADLTANWELEPWLTLSGTSGVAKDLSTGEIRAYVGPGLGLPRLFGDVGGASFGFLDEYGQIPGRSAWAQVLTQRPRFLQIVVRASWFQTRSLGPSVEDEFSLSTSIGAQLGPALSLRVGALGRAGGVPGVRPLHGGAGSLLGGALDAALAGRF